MYLINPKYDRIFLTPKYNWHEIYRSHGIEVAHENFVYEPISELQSDLEGDFSFWIESLQNLWIPYVS